jgi:GH25 family lysozyme M1 (1,4-beta-N-acetylmuramidase)
LSGLVPYCGEFFAIGEEQLIFPLYEEGSSTVIPKQLRCVTVHNLLEQEAVDIAKQLDEIFAVTYEEVSDDITNPDLRLKLSIGAAVYTYAISKEAYVNAVYYEEALISHEKHFTLTFDDDKIKITSIPYLSEEEYLGEFAGQITLNNNQLMLSNVTYATYALANQEDEENDSVILPRTEILGEERISLWGFQNETFLLELSKVLERNQISQENLVEEENGLVYYEVDEKKSIPGIDVSKFQGEIDWKKVKEAGVEFAIIRVGFRGFNEGTLELDPYFEKNIKGANAAGVKVGVYFFSQAINKEEALEEANFVLDKIKDYKVTYPVIIDTEHVITNDARANHLSRQTRTDVAKTFCEAVQQKGYQPMIYANTKWMIMGIDLEQLMDYDLWFAYYGDNLTFPYQFDMYQYASEGSIPGILGNVDLNLSFKDYEKVSTFEE